MKKWLIFNCCLLLAGCVLAQQKQGKVIIPSHKKTTGMSIVDTASVRIFYALNADNIHDVKTYIDLQCLEIGQRMSKYYSRFVFVSDSLVTKWEIENSNKDYCYRRLGEGGKKPDGWSEYQFSEYFKTPNSLTEYARMPHAMRKHDCQYTEPYPLQDWTIQADTLNVNGYLCQKATCHFRGRDFVAWFAKDIPIDNGPWKFGGLPGLILKVYDTKLLYTFECVKVESSPSQMRMYDYSSFKAVDRTKLLKLQRAINENYRKTGGAVSLSGRPFVFTPYEPLELE